MKAYDLGEHGRELILKLGLLLYIGSEYARAIDILNTTTESSASMKYL
jgi:hypothetical protein